MRRHLHKILLAAALVLPMQVWALGLGELRVNSQLNQYMDAEIELVGATQKDLDDLKAGLAPFALFQRAGIDRPDFLGDLRFRITRSLDNRSIIKVTSVRPISEPFVSFLVEIEWPRGRLLREYTVLLDPPTFAPAAVPEQLIAAPVQEPVDAIIFQDDVVTSEEAQPIIDEYLVDDVINEVVAEDDVMESLPLPEAEVAETEEPLEVFTEDDAEAFIEEYLEEDIEQYVDDSEAAVSDIDPWAESGQPIDQTSGTPIDVDNDGEIDGILVDDVDVTDGETYDSIYADVAPTYVSDSYTVGRGDTLWGIAQRFNSDPEATIQQAMLAIYQANPQAFQGNINRLKTGAVLTLPGPDELISLSQSAAIAEVRTQNEANQERIANLQGQVAATIGSVAEESNDGQLVLVAPDDEALDAGGADSGELADDVAEASSDSSLDDLFASSDDTSTADVASAIDEEDERLSLDSEALSTLEDQASEGSSLDDLFADNVSEDLADDVVEAEGSLDDLLADASADVEAVADEATDSLDDLFADESSDDAVDDLFADVSETFEEATDVEALEEDMASEDDLLVAEDDLFDDLEATVGEVVDETADAIDETADVGEEVVDAADTSAAEIEAQIDQMAEEMGQGFMTGLMGILKKVAIAIGGLLALVIGFLWWRSRKKRAAEEEAMFAAAEAELADEAPALPSADEAVVEEEEAVRTAIMEKPAEVAMDETGIEVLEDTGTFKPVSSAVLASGPGKDTDYPFEDTVAQDAAVQLEDADPIAEADFHMAYGLYDQAADQLKNALVKTPERTDLRMKLLEVYFVWGNKDAFAESARKLKKHLGDQPSSDWDNVAIMGKQICPGDDLFTGAAAASGASVDLELSGGDATEIFDAGFASDGDLDFELGEGGDDNVDVDMTSLSKSLNDDIELDFSIPEQTETKVIQNIDKPSAADDLKQEVRDAVAGLDDSEEDTAEMDLNKLGVDFDIESEKKEDYEKTLILPKQDSDDIDLDDVLAGLDDSAETSESRTPDLEDPSLEEGSLISDTLLQRDDGTAEFNIDLTGEAEELADPDLAGGKTVQLTDLGDLDITSGDSIFDDEETAQLDSQEFADLIASPQDETQEMSALESDDEDIDRTSTMKLPAVDLALPDGDDSADLDEVSTKLDLARAYVDMGDADGAKEILNEVIADGDDAQKKEAQSLLDSL